MGARKSLIDSPKVKDFRVVEGVYAGFNRKQSLQQNRERFERWVIRGELQRHKGVKTATARALGMTREGFWKKCKRLGLEG